MHGECRNRAPRLVECSAGTSHGPSGRAVGRPLRTYSEAEKNTCCCFFRVIARMANSPSTTAGAGEILFSGQRDFTSALAAPEFLQIDGSGRERAQPASGICSTSPSPAGLHRPPHPQVLPTTCVDDVSLPPDGRDDACEDGRDANDLDGCTRRDDLGMGRSLSPRRPPHPQFAAAGPTA